MFTSQPLIVTAAKLRELIADETHRNEQTLLDRLDRLEARLGAASDLDATWICSQQSPSLLDALRFGPGSRQEKRLDAILLDLLS